MKHKSNEQKRLSQDSLFNLHEIAYDLPQFVWFIQTYPDLLCICGIQEILDQLDRILLIDSSLPQLLSYDTTFKLGDFYVSMLLFRHVIFKESPVIPALFLIHERKFQSTHEIFFQIAIKKVPSLVKKVYPIVSDEEKAINNAISSILSNAKRLRCWNHIFRGVRHSLAPKVPRTEVKGFISDLRDLFHRPSLQEFTTRYKELSCNWRKTVRDYYNKNIHPEVAKSIGRWVLEEQGIYSSFSGVSNNQSESFNVVMKHLQEWKEVPVDSLVLTFYFLQCYFMNEISRGVCNQGNYHLHPSFLHLLEQPQDMEFISGCVLPEDIVKYIREGFSADSHEDMAANSEGGNQKNDTRMLPPLSQTARAKALLEAGKISFDPKLHLFNVLGSGDKPYVVRLFPAEYCSCPSKGLCYHIIAVKTSIGDSRESKGVTLNLTSLRRNTRSRGDKRSGRKRPRANDVDPGDSDEIKQSPKKCAPEIKDGTPENLDAVQHENDGNLINLTEKTSDSYTHEDEYVSDDEDNSFSIPTPSPINRFQDYENAPPGASMYHDTPIEVSEKMQHVVLENSTIFDQPPMGPLHTLIPEQLTSYLPSSFLHSYVVTTYKDKLNLDNLFHQHKEPIPLIIVISAESPDDTNKIYEDVVNDPETVQATLNVLRTMNPIIANLLIDYFEVEKWGMLPLKLTCNFMHII